MFGYRKYLVHGGEKERRRKGEKHLEKGNIWSAEEKKNGEGKGGKYLVLRGGKIWTQKRSKIFGEGKYL